MCRYFPAPPSVYPRIDDLRPGSRDSEVQEIVAWLNDPNGQAVRWVSGPAGIGKSTFAHFLAIHFREQLAAKVFVSDLADASREHLRANDMLKMIACQIGALYPRACSKIVEALRSKSGLQNTIPELLRRCIIEPLEAVRRDDPGRKLPFIVFMDALDEWDTQEQFLKGLAPLSAHSSLLRLVVFSRQPPPSFGPGKIGVSLVAQQLSGPQNNAILAHLANGLKRFATLDGQGLTYRDAERLAAVADGHFLWASVALALISQKLLKRSPRDLLEEICTSQGNVEKSSRGDERLERLYDKGFQLLFADIEERKGLEEYLGLILVLQESITIFVDARFLDFISRDTIKIFVAKLAVFYVRQPHWIQDIHPASSVFHCSFVKYLERVVAKSGGSAFASHERIGRACLNQLVLRNPRTRWFALPEYVAKYWPLHVARGSPSVDPGSDAAWKASEIQATLHKVSREGFAAWAKRFLQLVVPKSPPPDWYGQATSMALVLLDMAVEHRRQIAPGVKIALLEVAVRIQPDHSIAWFELGWERFRERAGDDETAGGWDSLVRTQEFSVATAVGQWAEFRASALVNLADALQGRFALGGRLEDLTRAIETKRELLSVSPASDSERYTRLVNLALVLRRRFQVQSSKDDLAEAIRLAREALALCPPGHDDRDEALMVLAEFLQYRYDLEGTPADILEMESLSQEAFELRPPGHPDRAETLILVIICCARMQALDGGKQYDKAIPLSRELISLRPPGHELRSEALKLCGVFLISRYGELQNMDDLAEAISLKQEVFELVPPGDPNRIQSLASLADALKLRFSRFGSTDDLERAIALNEEALALCPPGDEDRAFAVITVVGALDVRFSHTGDIDNITRAIPMIREVLDHHRPLQQHSVRTAVFANSLAWHLVLCRENRTQGGDIDIQEAVALAEEALAFRRTREAEMYHSELDTLARCLRHVPQRLDEALPLCREVLASVESESSSPGARKGKWMYLQTMTMVLLSLYRSHPEKEEYRDEGLVACREAFELCPQHFLHERSVLLELESALQGYSNNSNNSLDD